MAWDKHRGKLRKKTVYAGADWVGLLNLTELGENGTEFYEALLAQTERWGGFIERGAKASVPQVDRRYKATANALLTMYMNTDRGLIPQYGAGQCVHLTSYMCLPTFSESISALLLY